MKKIFSVLLTFILLASVLQVSLVQAGGSNSSGASGSNAAGITGSNSGGITNPLSGNADLPTLVKNLLHLMFLIGTMVVVFFIVLAGFKYVTAAGDPKKIQDAHSMLLWCAVGGAILLGAQTIADVIQSTVQQLGS